MRREERGERVVYIKKRMEKDPPPLINFVESGPLKECIVGRIIGVMMILMGVMAPLLGDR